jgi:hypothetical protein
VEGSGGTFITIAEGGQTHGCTGEKSVASIDCQASQNINEYRGEGIFTFVSDFGDQVGPFTEYTGAGSYLTIC